MGSIRFRVRNRNAKISNIFRVSMSGIFGVCVWGVGGRLMRESCLRVIGLTRTRDTCFIEKVPPTIKNQR